MRWRESERDRDRQTYIQTEKSNKKRRTCVLTRCMTLLERLSKTVKARTRPHRQAETPLDHTGEPRPFHHLLC